MAIKQVWYSNKADQRSPDTIHQILMYGKLNDIRRLRNTIGQTKLTELFLDYPKKVYTSSALNFVKKFILHINARIDEQKYLKNTSRITR